MQVDRLIATGARRQGEVALSELPRLSAELLEATPVATYDMAFGRDEDGRQLVSGKLAVTVSMRCQRCLEPVQVTLAPQFVWECVWSETQFPNVAAGHDPYLLSEDPVPLYEMIEDELILSLPLVPGHQEHEACVPPAVPEAVAGAPEKTPKQRPHPLAGLAKLKRNDE